MIGRNLESGPATVAGAPDPRSGAVWDALRRDVPELTRDVDEWTRELMQWHFSEDTGCAFWLDHRDALGFDPIADIRTYDDLSRFGHFDKERLRRSPVRRLIPRGLAGRPVRTFETGGTTGTPCRVPNITRYALDVRIYSSILAARGLHGLNALVMAPTGPHPYGSFVSSLLDTWGGSAFFIDMDPRWVKELVRRGESSSTYVDHLCRQVLDVLDGESPGLLFTTPPLLFALVTTIGRPLADLGIRAVCTGGTAFTEEEARFVRTEYLRDVQWIDTYGNTLMGHALQADPTGDGRHSSHLPPPFGRITVVAPDEPSRTVSYGERGRVMITTLHQDLFLPNLLERDSAIRTPPHPWFPWDGVTQVAPFEGPDTERALIGIY